MVLRRQEIKTDTVSQPRKALLDWANLLMKKSCKIDIKNMWSTTGFIATAFRLVCRLPDLDRNTSRISPLASGKRGHSSETSARASMNQRVYPGSTK